MFADVLAYGWPMLAVMAVSAVVIGFSKTSFGGIAAIAVAVFALVMPAKESTAGILLLLILGDAVAIALYGRNVKWRLLLRLVPSVIPGLLLGTLFMRFVDDVTMRRTIGALLLLSVFLQWRQRRRHAETPPTGEVHWLAAALAGVAAGFTTMTANAAGPVMALYFLACRIDKKRFIGTNAWFFGVVNVSKVPLAAGLGLYNPGLLTLDLTLAPFVLVGAAIGVRVIKKVSQRQFETVTIVASAVASLALLLR